MSSLSWNKCWRYQCTILSSKFILAETCKKLQQQSNYVITATKVNSHLVGVSTQLKHFLLKAQVYNDCPETGYLLSKLLNRLSLSKSIKKIFKHNKKFTC